jgi:hypothetical protein
VTTQEGVLLWPRHTSLTSLIPAPAALLPFPFWKDGLRVQRPERLYFWRPSVVSWETLTLGTAHGSSCHAQREPLIVAVSVGARKCQRLASFLQRPGIAKRSYFEAQFMYVVAHLTSLHHGHRGGGRPLDHHRLFQMASERCTNHNVFIRGYTLP